MAKYRWMMPSFPRVDIAGQLGGIEGIAGGTWTDGEAHIPKGETAERARYDKRYLARVRGEFGKNPRIRFRRVEVDARKLLQSNAASNRERYAMYKRMLRAGARVPPLVVKDAGGPSGDMYLVLDGNHRRQAALDTKKHKLPALLLEYV